MIFVPMSRGYKCLVAIIGWVLSPRPGFAIASYARRRCENDASIGAIGSQAGVWQYARNGWRPWLDGNPYIADVTFALVIGKKKFSLRCFL